MSKNYCFILVCCILLLFHLLNSLFANPPSKRYSIEEINIAAEILPDGSLLIKEDRTYHFQGTFHWADYRLPLDNLGAITDFELSENGLNYQAQQNEEPGNYQSFQNNEEFYVKWFYQAKNENKTFTLKYRVQNAVTVYNDVAEFYYKFVGVHSQMTIGSVDVLLMFPQAADTSLVRAWAHGPLHGHLAFENGDIHLWVKPLPERNWWEARVIFPPEWVPSAQKYRNANMKEQIMDEERLLVEQSNTKRAELLRKYEFREKHQKTAFEGNLILAVVGLAAFIFLYNRFGRGFQVPFHSKITSEVPQDISPAIANYLYYSGQVGAGAMVATILDLARKGFLKIEETQKEKKSIFGTSKKSSYTLSLNSEKYESEKRNLAEYERDLVDFIFQGIASGQIEIEFEKINKEHSHVTKWFLKWKKIIAEQYGNRSIYDKLSVKGTVISAVISFLILTVGVISIIYFGVPGVISLVAGVVLFGLSFAILRYTKEVKLLRTKLIAFRQYLSKYHFRGQITSLTESIEKLLIYGVALGISTKVIKEMLTTIPEIQTMSYFPWYLGATAHSSPTGFADAVSSMVTLMGTTMGSAAGVGGGASVGGGAGVGGASGGAG